MAVVAELGGVDWFILGDRDIGLHLVRSERLRAGEPLSAVTADFARRYGLRRGCCPRATTACARASSRADGELAFQEWLVGRRAADPVRAVRFEGVPGARPAPGVLEAIESADAIVLAPSNPFVSLDPILAVDGVRAAVAARRERVVAITPMIGAQAVKGPLAGMLETLGHEVSAVGVASVLAPLAAGFVLDSADEERAARHPRARPARGLRADAHARRRERRRRGARRARPAVSDVAVTGAARAAGARRRRRSRRPARWMPRSAPPAACATGDVVCVAQKAVSKVEGRSVPLASVSRRQRALEIAADEGDPRMIELILGESARIVRRRGAFLICETRHGFVCAAAGVDRSNAGGGDVAVLLPLDPDASARGLRDAFARDRRGRA